MRALIYTRCSTDEQAANGNTLEMQEERCKAFVVSKGWECAGVFSDPGYSAKSLDRPGIATMLNLVKIRPRRVDAIVVLKLDRLTRSVVDLGNLLTSFEKHHVALAGPEVVFDTSTPVGRLMANLLCAVSQWEREEIGARTRAVLSHKRQHGLIHAPHEPFGYRREGDRFVPAPNELGIIATMREMRSHGATFRQIVAHLNGNGIETKRGGKWNPGTVRDILLRNSASKEVAV
jgi:DNA invertase Pin-like site-specific DNA recombinase